MESVYNLIQSNPEFFAWIFGGVNALWIAFAYFNRQSHDRAMERLRSSLQIREVDVVPLLEKLLRLEEAAGEAKEIVTSYKSTSDRKSLFWPLRSKLEQFTGQLSKYPTLMQSVRDFNHYSAILVEEDPHPECRAEVLQFFSVLMNEIECVRQNAKNA